jgi:hypothetical protein
MSGLDVARFGSAFDAALIDAIAQQDPDVARRLLAELRAGNYEIEVDGTPPTITVRIAGSVVLEANLYQEPKGVRLN